MQGDKLAAFIVLALYYQGLRSTTMKLGNLTALDSLGLIVRDLSKYQDGQCLTKSSCSSIAATVARISWVVDNPTTQSFKEQLTARFTNDRIIENGGWRYFTALGLVLSAWDHRVGRPQFVYFPSHIACSDSHVALLHGGLWPKERSSYYLSYGWPWTTKCGKLALVGFCIAPLVGNSTGNNLLVYLNTWSNIERQSSKEP